MGFEDAGILGEGTNDGEGITTTEEGEEEGCGTTTRGGIGIIIRGGVSTIIEGVVGTKGGRGVGTVIGGRVGTIVRGGVGTITGGGMGTITKGGLGTITGGGVASTIGTNMDGNGMGATAGEVDCNGALCVLATMIGMDVDGLVGGTFIR